MKYPKILFFVLFCGVPLSAQQQPRVVETVKAAKHSMVKTVRLMAILEAQKEAVIKSEVTGVITKINSKSGQIVKKGDILLEISNDGERNNLQLSQTTTRLAKTNHARVKKLFESGDASLHELETAHKELVDARLLEQKAKSAFGQTVVTSPFNGICGVFDVTSGAHVVPGQSIVKIVNSNKLYARLSVPQNLILKINEGAKVGIGDVQGVIESIERVIDTTTGMATARASVENNGSLIPGSMVYVNIVTERKNDALSLPQEAVFLRNGAKHVFVVKNKIINLTKISVGLKTNKHIEIIKGLNVGDEVVLRGHGHLYDKSQVRIAL